MDRHTDERFTELEESIARLDKKLDVMIERMLLLQTHLAFATTLPDSLQMFSPDELMKVIDDSHKVLRFRKALKKAIEEKHVLKGPSPESLN